jgi:dihydrofolate synthase/folylpolyglutamate synthase
VNRVQPLFDTIHQSFCEITVALAVDYFAQQRVDVAVFDVGLGGRLDSTNVITPLVSVITNIGMDHKDLLGDTLVKIAEEKAGIIKPGIPIIVSERQQEVESVFIWKAKEAGADLVFAQDHYNVTSTSKQLDVRCNNSLYISDLEIDLKGNYQLKNLPGIFNAVDELNQSGFSISKENVVHGLKNTTKQTGLKGRWQQLGEHPLVICDTGHNEDGIKEVVAQISQQSFDKLHIVWGMVKDKEPDEILRLLPVDAHYYFCQATIPRALDVKTLQHKARAFGLHGVAIPNVNDALQQAKKNAGQGDFIFIGGSTFVVAEIDGL